ncbi:hypothetical protein NECAME_06027 [Necator americanus]|uniref:7TM GPCR serpentine receptor class x (Srx) domain-containing protein n=1 Tax=Necator americanus TaxID=51031 RepID=W2TWX6_NECAM|nr:hypothetical protein NECAME_06027 [Necator americanus]ETN86313.1 hypothetical protein NECAME_06027 [Necator americanus]
MSDTIDTELSTLFHLPDNKLAAIITFMVSSFGVYCHCIVIASLLRMVSRTTSYYILVLSQSICEVAFCITFALYYSPMLFL